MIPLYIREMADDRAAGLPWRDVAERYGYGSAKSAQNALYNAARRDPTLRRVLRPYRPTDTTTTTTGPAPQRGRGPRREGAMSIEELRRLLDAATPRPWTEFAESGDWWVEGADGIGVCESNEAWNHQGDVDLMIAAVNALPALLVVVEASQRLHRAHKVTHEAVKDWTSDVYRAAVDETNAAYDAWLAALAALEAPNGD